MRVYRWSSQGTSFPWFAILLLVLGIGLLIEIVFPDLSFGSLIILAAGLAFGAAWLGNPHALLIRDSTDDADIPAIGAWLGGHAVFPEGVNVGFAALRGRGAIDLRVVERGAGETLACGSGACAAVAILRRFGRVDERVEVFLPGGRLVIQWPGNAAPVSMKGPAEHVFRGIMNE